MRTLRQRLAAVVAMALLGVTGLAVAAWSPASMGLVPAASADDGAGDDDGGDDDDDDGGQAPVGGVDTGLGGASGPAQDGDDDADDGGTGDDDAGDDSADDGAGDDADDGGQVPAGGVDTGQGAATGPTQDGDDGAGDDGAGDDADDGGQVPAGGVDTGQGGVADTWSGEPVSNDRSVGDIAGVAVPAVALGLGGLVVGRLVLARLRGSQG